MAETGPMRISLSLPRWRSTAPRWLKYATCAAFEEVSDLPPDTVSVNYKGKSQAVGHADAHLLVHRHRGFHGVAAATGGDVRGGSHRSSSADPGGLAAHGGKEIDTQGDAFFAVFTSPSACVAAAIEMQRALVSHPWPAGEGVRVRMGVHSGEASETAAGLVGLDVHRAARIAAVAHGGQIVLSAATAALLGDSMPAGASLKDLGLHRLKDLGRPEQLFQLEADGLPAAFPPLRSLDNPKLLNNLPAQVSSFIGRDAELAEVRRLITASRLVTLTGAGGAGKTRLGLQVAAGLLDGSGDGVWFADLAPLQDPDLVAVTVANVLGIPRGPGPPRHRHARRRGRPAAACWCCWTTASTSSTPAPSSPTRCCGIARTSCCSRPAVSRCGIDGERVHRVPSLDTPADDDDVEAIRNSEAVRLFADRAAAARGAARLGRADRLGCRPDLPAAGRHPAGHRAGRGPPAGHVGDRAGRPARSAFLAPDRRLARGPAAPADAARHGRLVLGAAERRRAPCARPRCRCSPGGSTWPPPRRSPRARMCSADEVIGHLGALVDKSLVQFDDTGAGPARYRLLETVRQYAARQLEAQDPVGGRRRPDRPSRPLPGSRGSGGSTACGTRSGRSGWTVSISSSATSGPRSPSA